jgi:predicted NBD/HSP70 family sugar kinase
MLVMIEKARRGLKEGRVSKMKAASLEHYEKASETLISAAIAGDQFAVELFSEDGYNIGRGIAILIHILNPEVIILSGRGSAAGKIWFAPIQQALNKHCIPRIAANTVIELSDLGHRAELIGSAVLVMENFEMPRIRNEVISVTH